jgi:hypothetical protein
MTREEIIKSKNKSMFIIEDDGVKPIGSLPGVGVVDKDKFKKHFDKYNFLDSKVNKIGQFFLYEKILNSSYPLDHELFYPKLGMYINALLCDQTIEVEWVDIRRTWEWKIEYDYEVKDKDGVSNKYKNYFGEIETEIQRLPIWTDDLLVYGCWETMPNWKQLRQAYERTWWFHRTTDELRNIQLDRLLS